MTGMTQMTIVRPERQLPNETTNTQALLEAVLFSLGQCLPFTHEFHAGPQPHMAVVSSSTEEKRS